jgi:hypothetical protein
LGQAKVSYLTVLKIRFRKSGAAPSFATLAVSLDNIIAIKAQEPYRNRYGTQYPSGHLINFKAVVGNKSPGIYRENSSKR